MARRRFAGIAASAIVLPLLVIAQPAPAAATEAATVKPVPAPATGLASDVRELTRKLGVETPICEAVAERAGAKTYFIEPVEHDAYVAGISHMPFVLAAALVNMTSRAPSWREMSALAATGFRDTTRLASGDVTMHRDIVMTNRVALERWLTESIDELTTLNDAVVRGDEGVITTYFAQAHAARATWLEQKPGMRPGEAEFEDTGMDLVQKPSLFGRADRGKRK